MTQLVIENFKCFYQTSIKINGLTFFAGANGNGKSTAIQALLFLRRTIEHCAAWENERYSLKVINGLNVELNGPYCLALGNSSFILPKNSNTSEIVIGLENIDRKIIVHYRADDSRLWLTPISVVNDNGNSSSICLQQFYYLNAERVGPRISQGIKFYDFPNTGYQGEFVAQLIADTERNYRFEIDEQRRHPVTPSPRLEQQVNAWLSELMPGVSISASYDPNTNSAQIKIDNYFTKGDSTIATNIGFGISYVLPIIVTGLIAKKGAYVIVENPEAHLHPSAQSKIGRFLAMVANAGIKVIVETHSDHVINGVQIAAAKGEISSEQITINFFSQPQDTEDVVETANIVQPIVESISVNRQGELSHWPKGFFDQTQNDFAQLFKIRRG